MFRALTNQPSTLPAPYAHIAPGNQSQSEAKKRAHFVACIVCATILAFSQTPAIAADQNPQSVQSVQNQSPQTTTPAHTGAPTQTAAPGQQVAPAPITLQAEEDYWIDPDRPHIADSSVNVPKGLWLQENGFQQLFLNRRSNTFDFPETLIRLGISNRTELRYNAPDFFTLSATTLNPSLAAVHERAVRFENMQAGFKTRLGPIGPMKFQIAVNPYITIPTGFPGQGSRVDPNIKFPFSQELNEHWDIEGMQSFFFPSDANGHRNADWQNSFVLNRSWGRQKNVFIEYVGDLFDHGPMSNLIHFGAAYRPDRRQQMDTQFGFRMTNSAPIAFFGFGYSFLLGNLNTPRLTPSKFPQK
jgi:hypothetical protein